MVTVPPLTAPALAGTGPVQEAGVAAWAALIETSNDALSATAPVIARPFFLRFI